MIKYLVKMKRAEEMKQELIKVERADLIDFMNTIDADDFVECNGIKCLEYHIKSLDQEDIQDILDEMVELGYHVEVVYQDNKLLWLVLSITNNPGVFKRTSFGCNSFVDSVDNLNFNYAHPSHMFIKNFKL